MGKKTDTILLPNICCRVQSTALSAILCIKDATCNTYYKDTNNVINLGEVSADFGQPWLPAEEYLTLLVHEDLAKDLKLIKPNATATTVAPPNVTTTTSTTSTTTLTTSTTATTTTEEDGPTVATLPAAAATPSPSNLIGFGFFTTGQNQGDGISHHDSYATNDLTWDKPTYLSDFAVVDGQEDPLLIEKMPNGNILQCGSGVINRKCTSYDVINEVWTDVGPAMTLVESPLVEIPS